MSSSFQIKGFEKLNKALEDSREQIKEEFLDSMADAVLSEAQRLLKEGKIPNSKSPEKNAFYTGELANRSNGVAEDGENKRRVYFDTPYALATEYGRPKGSHPPVQPLIEWADYRGFKDPVGSAWAIAKKMERDGLPPRPFLQPAVVFTRSILRDIWIDAVKKAKIDNGL